MDWKDFVDPNAPPGRYLRWKEVERNTGLSRTTAWRLQRSGDFPRPYVISPGRVGYLEAEVDAWRASRGHRSAAEPRPPADGAAEPPAEARPGKPVGVAREPADVRSSVPTAPHRLSRARRLQQGAVQQAQIHFDF